MRKTSIPTRCRSRCTPLGGRITRRWSVNSRPCERARHLADEKKVREAPSRSLHRTSFLAPLSQFGPIPTRRESAQPRERSRESELGGVSHLTCDRAHGLVCLAQVPRGQLHAPAREIRERSLADQGREAARQR